MMKLIKRFYLSETSPQYFPTVSNVSNILGVSRAVGGAFQTTLRETPLATATLVQPGEAIASFAKGIAKG